jgi:hypothetical protein
MVETPDFLADRLQVEGEKTITYFNSLTDEQWELTVYTEGSIWKVRDVLAHYAMAERGFLSLFKNIVAGGPGASEDFDIDRFNASQQQKSQAMPSQKLIDLFQTTRKEMILLVKGLSATDLAKQGRHPFLGLTTLGEMVKMVYRHNQIHYRDLRKLLPDGDAHK